MATSKPHLTHCSLDPPPKPSLAWPSALSGPPPCSLHDSACNLAPPLPPPSPKPPPVLQPHPQKQLFNVPSNTATVISCGCQTHPGLAPLFLHPSPSTNTLPPSTDDEKSHEKQDTKDCILSLPPPPPHLT